MAVWRLLERIRQRLLQSQAWLEQQIDGWGSENTFSASASPEYEDAIQTPLPEHWAELVRRQAPWLLDSTSKSRGNTQHAAPLSAAHSTIAQSHKPAMDDLRYADDGGAVHGSVVADTASVAPTDITSQNTQSKQTPHRSTAPVFHQADGEESRNTHSGFGEELTEKWDLNIVPPVDELNGAEYAVDRPLFPAEGEAGSVKAEVSRYSLYDEGEPETTERTMYRTQHHSESDAGRRTRMPTVKGSEKEALTVTLLWPPLPDEKEEAVSGNDPWPALDLESDKESEHGEEWGRQWSV